LIVTHFTFPSLPSILHLCLVKVYAVEVLVCVRGFGGKSHALHFYQHHPYTNTSFPLAVLTA